MNVKKKRVVVTGVGAITPIGCGIQSIENSLKNSISGIQNITSFDTEDLPVKFAGIAAEFNPYNYLEAKEVRRNDRFIQMCLAASDIAVAESRISKSHLNSAGVAIGVGLGGLYSIESATLTLKNLGAKKVSPFLIPSILSNLASGQISIRHQTHGANFAISSACASGSQSIGYAYREIQSGRSDVWIAGGAEAPITPLSIAGFSSARALSRRNENPKLASRPFDQHRDGFVLGEGAAVFIIESLESAIRRDAKIFIEIVGFGISSDGYHITDPDPNGEGAFRAMKEAIEDAGISKKEIDYVNAHATSTELGDRIENVAMERIFGDQIEDLLVSSTKSHTGHACGAAGAIETAFCSLMLQSEFIPPALNLINQGSEFRFRSPQPADIEFKPNIIMNNSFGFGGINTSLILSKFKN